MPEKSELKASRFPVQTDIDFRRNPILDSPFSIIKMDLNELKIYMDRLNEFIEGPDIAALRFCECCANIS